MTRFLPALSFILLSWGLGRLQAARAQTPAMSLMGSVQTDVREPLPGAAITVIHLPSGVRHAAASDATGHFVIGSLLVGGPYLIRVGEGGYRPQTVENIFLENGKTANFTVTLSKLADTPARERSNRNKEVTTEALAPQAVVGGPVLITTNTATPGRRRAGKAAVIAAAAPAILPPVVAPTAPVVMAPAPAAGPSTSSRYPATRYPARRTTPPRTDPIVPGRYDAKSGNYLYDTGQLTTLKLAGGAGIAAVGVNSTESYLYRFLTDPKVQVDTVDLTNGWYNFDKVFFETGKATLTAESLHQLRNIATLLRAFPKARIKLGGYTDNTGDYRVNRQLSEARARTAWASLVEMGVSPARIEARGYGPNYSIAANETEEGRAQNRRLSVKVLQK